MKRRFAQILLIGLSVAIFLSLAVSIWQSRNPLRKYGVSYEKTSGDHAEYQHLWFYLDRQGKRTDVVTVIGEELQVEFKNSGDVPDIIVRSETNKSSFVLLRLNTSDQTKPPIELIENHNLGVHYTPPWERYYQ